MSVLGGLVPLQALEGGHERAAWVLISKGAPLDVEDQKQCAPLTLGLQAAR